MTTPLFAANPLKALRFNQTRFVIVMASSLALAALLMIAASQPDRKQTSPAISPPVPPAGMAAGGVVAGAGVVEPSSELVTVGVAVPGVIETVLVQSGERVLAGQPLIVVDDRDARAALAQQQAALGYARRAVESAAVELDNARRQFAPYAALDDPRAVAETQVIDRRAAIAAASARLALARADVGRAEAAVAAARTEVARRTVRAPIDGEVLQVRGRPGQYAAISATDLVTIGETRPRHVRIDIDENEIGRIDEQAAAVISPRGNARRQVRAALVRVEPLIIPKRSLTNASNERVDVRVQQRIYRLPDDAADFRIGQQVDAFVPARRG